MTTSKYVFAFTVAGLLALAACDRTPPEQQPVREQAAAPADAGSREPADADEETTQQASRADRTDPRTLPVPAHEDGAHGDPRLAVEADELERLVGGDAAPDDQKNAALVHGPCLGVRAPDSQERRRYG